jgi:hypothetical protein
MSARFLGEILERLGTARIGHGDLISGAAEAARQRPPMAPEPMIPILMTVSSNCLLAKGLRRPAVASLL